MQFSVISKVGKGAFSIIVQTISEDAEQCEATYWSLQNPACDRLVKTFDHQLMSAACEQISNSFHRLPIQFVSCQLVQEKASEKCRIVLLKSSLYCISALVSLQTLWHPRNNAALNIFNFHLSVLHGKPATVKTVVFSSTFSLKVKH